MQRPEARVESRTFLSKEECVAKKSPVRWGGKGELRIGRPRCGWRRDRFGVKQSRRRDERR